jgi:hypothetical protein
MPISPQYILLAYYSSQLQCAVSSLPHIGPMGTYFGKLLELLLKPAEVDERKLSF